MSFVDEKIFEYEKSVYQKLTREAWNDLNFDLSEVVLIQRYHVTIVYLKSISRLTYTADETFKRPIAKVWLPWVNTDEAKLIEYLRIQDPLVPRENYTAIGKEK